MAVEASLNPAHGGVDDTNLNPTHPNVTPVDLVFQPTRPPRAIATDMPPTAPPTSIQVTLPAFTPAGTIVLNNNTSVGAGLAPPALSPPATSPFVVEASLNPTNVPDSGDSTPYPVPQPAPNDVIIGSSVQGRPIFARRFGSGERAVVLVGGMHGGWEANTVALIDALTGYFAANIGDIPPNVSLYLIPVANPDGLLFGRTADGRFNGRGVDLNRNWGCGWQPEAYWRDQQVEAGAAPFSEPESAALAAFLHQIQPSVALFYHSAAGGIFAGDCQQAIREVDSALIAATYGEAAGYAYGDPFTAYPVTGTAAAWADGEGIAAADVELESWNDAEFDRNLAGVLALLRWVAR